MNIIFDGNLDSLLAALPALIGAAYFFVGYVFYLARCFVWGEAVDPEMHSRGSSAFIGYHMRHYFVWVTRPLWALTLASGVRAITVTSVAILLGVAAGASVAWGSFAIGGWLFLLSGILDAMDGRLARARDEVSAAGAAIDSVMDRYVDSAMLMGLAWYYRESWVLVVVLFALLGTSVVPYVRAKAEAMGVTVKPGGMQRAERVLYLGGAVALSPALEATLLAGQSSAPGYPTHQLAIWGLAFLAVSSNLTAVVRFRNLLMALGGESVARLQSPRAAAAVSAGERANGHARAEAAHGARRPDEVGGPVSAEVIF